VMRILSLSHRLQHPKCDNYSIITAPNLMDYQGIVLDIGATFEHITQAASGDLYLETFGGDTVDNSGDIDGNVGLYGLLERRREELIGALNNGAVVVVFGAGPNQTFAVKGSNGMDSYWLLPAPQDLTWNAEVLRASDGESILVTDYSNPFVRVFETYEKDVAYRVRFDLKATRTGKMFLSSTGGAPVGVQFPVLNGQLVFLPSPKNVGAQWLSNREADAIIEAISETIGQAATEEPSWVKKFLVPGESSLQEDFDRLKEISESATSQMEEAKSILESRQSLKALLWGADMHFKKAVEEALVILGFELKSDQNAPTHVSFEGRELFVESVTSQESVSMSPHYALRDRIDDKIQRVAAPVRGLVVVNGWRTADPERRDKPFVSALEAGAESTGYSLLTGYQLYKLCLRVLEEEISSEELEQTRTYLFETDGAVEMTEPLTDAADN